LLAGTDTSTVTNEWAMTEIVRHPEIQRKLHDELDAVVGRDRVVEERDLTELRYLICIVKETLRLHPANCFTLPRHAMEDATLAGYHVPKGCTILLNLFSAGRDGAVWADPLRFDPARWAGSANPSGLPDDRLYVFGAGRRACPGYNLGSTLVLLSLARLFHGFSWSLPPGVSADSIDMSETAGFANTRKERLLAVAKPRLAAHLYGAKFP
jgi:cytochrome P450